MNLDETFFGTLNVVKFWCDEEYSEFSVRIFDKGDRLKDSR